MGREYVIQSWVKHDANDPRIIPDDMIDHMVGYSGEQIGNRAAKSNGNTKTRSVRPGWLANGNADIASAADPSDDAKNNPLYSIDPAFKVLEEYPAKLAALDKAYEEKRVAWTVYNTAKMVLDAKLIKAQEKINKLVTIAQEEDQDDQEEEEEIMPTLEEEEIQPYMPTEEEKRQALKNYENCLV